ncbi:twin-arginine translocation signal domain-containing protein [Dermabacteraceae bacterium TAE3-ERU5]|nr:twin-arginine translocation signal domain-containing protein [Dermabacteraceae bacterium TAE3-ERU5]
MSKQTSRRSFLYATGLGASLLAFTGCAEETLPPAADPGPTVDGATPVAGAEQTGRVVKDVVASIVAADKALDANLLPPRISGSLREFRTDLYGIIKKDPLYLGAMERPSAEIVASVATSEEAYPRTILAVIRAEKKDGLPYFMVLQQNGPREPYSCWGWAKQAASAPAIPAAAVGAQPVKADDANLLMQPNEAIAKYVDALNGGLKDGLEKSIAEDAFMTSVHDLIKRTRDQLNQGVEPDSIATVEEKFTRHDGEYAGFRTAEGGALVFASLRSSRTVTVKKGSVKLSESVFTKLIGKDSYTKHLTIDSGEIIVLHIPAKAKGGKISLVAAYKPLLGANGE